MNIIDLATKTMQTAIKSVVDAIKTVVDGTKTKIDTIDKNIGSQSDLSSSSGSVHAKLKDIKSNLNSGINAIKSIQRGTYILGESATSGDTTISSVNLSKSVVIINQKNGIGANNGDQAMCEFVTSTTLRFSKSDVGQVALIYWQVIEYY